MALKWLQRSFSFVTMSLTRLRHVLPACLNRIIMIRMATFPTLSPEFRQQRLAYPPGKIRMVLDTDTYNEIDDQFAVVYALLSPELLKVEAIYAAPFSNDNSSGPGDGMEKSYARRFIKKTK